MKIYKYEYNKIEELTVPPELTVIQDCIFDLDTCTFISKPTIKLGDLKWEFPYISACSCRGENSDTDVPWSCPAYLGFQIKTARSLFIMPWGIAVNCSISTDILDSYYSVLEHKPQNVIKGVTNYNYGLIVEYLKSQNLVSGRANLSKEQQVAIRNISLSL